MMGDFKIDSSYVKHPKQDGEINVYINREAAESKDCFSTSRKVIFVNGMKNAGKDHAESALALSLVQMCPVIGVYNATDGFWMDLAQCIGDKNQFQGFSKSATNTAASAKAQAEAQALAQARRMKIQAALSRNKAQVSLFNLLNLPENRKHEIFAHSQGNLIVSNVLQAIAALEGSESLRGRTVHTFGSPAVHYPKEIQLFEHGYTFDPVNWLSGIDFSMSISKVGMPTGSKNPITHGFLWYMQDDPRFVINRFRTGGWGMTFNMDEDGLAACLARMGTNMPRVKKVMAYLDAHHNSDADDVALAYVHRIKNDSSIVAALRTHKDLVHLLIKTMDEGWTSGAEKEAINWLKKLAT